MKHSESIKEISSALITTQAALTEAKYDSKNPHFKSDYASLEAFLKIARPELAKNGLAVTQGVGGDKDSMVLQTTLMHRSGEFVTYEMPLLLTKQDMQGLGSAVTYARRYSLSALLGMGSEDDDGNHASAPQKQQSIPSPFLDDEIDRPDPSNFKITFGKYSGKQIKDIDPFALDGYVKYILDESRKKQKPITGNVQSFVSNAEAFLDSITVKQS